MSTAQAVAPLPGAGCGRDLLESLRLDPVKPMYRYQQVARRLTGEIAARHFSPATRLPGQREIAEALDVSRPAVREAIASLETEGLIVTRPGAGSYVARGAPARARALLAAGISSDVSPVALLEAREFLEPGIARIAAQQEQPDGDQAESLLALMESVSDLADAEARRVWSDADRFFHRQLAMMSRNALLIGFSDQMASIMDQPLWKALRDDALADRSRVQVYAAQHRLIYEAIRAGDALAAAFYASEHIVGVRADLLESRS